MNLVRWSPFPEFETIDRRMRRILGEFGIVPTALPAADVYETDKAYVFELEVPGFDEKELTWSRACAEDRESVNCPDGRFLAARHALLTKRRMPWPEPHTQPKLATSS